MNKELSIKSKLLFNSLDTNYKVVLDTTCDIKKRKKALNNIFSVYKMTIRPFISDETKEYQTLVNSKIDEKYQVLEDSIGSKVNLGFIVLSVPVILEDLKEMVRTCKTTIPKINKLWGID